MRTVPGVVGIVGTGFVARGLARALRRAGDFTIGAVLTRRRGTPLPGFDESEIVTDVDALVDRAGIIVETSGDPLHATDVIERALLAGRPVVTMGSEWHVTAGSFYRGLGFVTEAEGDQAGSLAALSEDGRAMGFEPLAYVNVKRFLNTAPTRAEMDHFARLQGISLSQVTAFTDGSKVQIEQAHVANGLGADIIRAGLLGPAADFDSGLETLARAAEAHGGPIADYVLTGEMPGAVMIIARHDPEEAAVLGYFKMGDGPLYRLVRPYHLCQLEILKTLRRVVAGGSVLLDNGARPTISVAAVAKRRLAAGERIARGLGSFDARGIAVRIAESAGHLPVTLMQDVVVRRAIEPGETIMRQDVDLPESRALRAWLATEEDVLRSAQGRGAQ